MSAVPKLADKKSLKNLVPLNGLSATHFEELAKKANILELKPGKYLFKKGERDNSTCFILEGEIALVDGSDIKLTIEGGTEEGRHPIAAQQPRQLGARAKTRCTIVSIDSGLLDVMLAYEQSSGYEVDDIESDDEDWMTRMMQSDLMQKLPANNLQQLFMRMEEVEVKASEVIVNQDDEGDYYYIIKQGTCIVSRKPSANAREVKLAELKDGDSFGEESLLSGAKRNASVTMLTNGILMRLSQKDFNELLKAPLLNQVTYTEAQKMVNDGAVYLDVRLPGEYSNAHLPESINMPLAAIRSEITSIDRDKDYIVYCDTGRRSTSAVFLLGQFGIEAHVLKDGLGNVPMEDYTQVKEKETESAEIIDINRDKPDSVDQHAANAELQAVKEEKAQLDNKISMLVAEVSSLKEQIGKSEEKIAQQESELQETQVSVQQEQANVKGLEEELQGLRDLEIEADKLKEQLSKAQNAAKEQEKLLSTVQQSDESSQKKMLSQQADMEKLEKELQSAVARATKAEEAHTTNISELESLRVEMDRLQAERSRLADKLESIEREKEALGKDVDTSVTALNEEISTLRASIAELQEIKSSVETDLQQERQQHASLQLQLDEKVNAQQALDSQITELRQALDAEHKKAQQLDSDNAARFAELETLRGRLDQESQSSQEQTSGLQQQIQEFQQQKTQLQQELQVSVERVSSLESELQQLVTEKESILNDREQNTQQLQTELQESEQQRAQLHTEISELNSKFQASESSLASLKEAREQEKGNGLERIKTLESDLEKAAGEHGAQVSSMQTQLSEYEEQQQRLHAEISELNSKLQETESSLASLKEAREQEKGNGLERIKTLESDLEKASGEHSAQVSAMQTQLTEYEEQQRQLHAEIETLIEQSADYASKLVDEQASYEQQNQASQETISELQATVKDNEARESGLLAQLAEYGDSRRLMEAEIKALKERSAEYEAMFAAEKHTLEQENLASQNAINSLKSELESLSQQKSEHESELQTRLSESEDVRQQQAQEIEGLASRIEDYEARLASASENAEQQSKHSLDKINVLETELQNVHNKTAELEQARQELEQSAQQYKQEIEQGKEDRRQLESQLEALNSDLENLRAAKTESEQEQEKQIIEYRQKIELHKIEHAAVDERYQRAQKRIDELVQINTQMESGASDEAMQNELLGLRNALNDAEEKLQDNAGLLAEKTFESDDLRKELAALRAVYVQKESELSELHKDLQSATQTISDFDQQDNDSIKAKQAAEEELDLVRQRFEQSEIESKEIITSLQNELQGKDSLINDYNSQASEANALRTDAESAFKVMEEEVDKLRQESEQYQQSLHNSHEELQGLKLELDKLRDEQKNWRITEQDLTRTSEVELSQARIKELEAELQQSRNDIDKARAKMEILESTVQQNAQSNLENELQGKMEQLKHDMESQLERYKSELDDESSKLKKENEKLRDELQKTYKEQEVAIQTGRPAANSQQVNTTEATDHASTMQDHSALFNLPDIDKNLFNTNADRVPQKSNKLMIVILVLLFSLMSAGGVYWYFVMNNGGQDVSRPLASAANRSSDAISKTVPSTQVAAARSISDKPVSNAVPQKTVKTTAKKAKPGPAINGQLKATRVFSDFLESGGSGPVMVGVPGGIFTMGSPDNSPHFNERPQRKVSIRKFSIAKHEVSFDDYDRFAENTGRPRPADNGWGRGKRPVINVTWEDAVAYTQWLSEQTGHQYRLPSESEWEYAARAGTKGKYWWGDEYEANRANCFNCSSRWDGSKSAPVGSFSASPLGLHDMVGNVMEWVSDCYHQNYDGAPIDGTIWAQETCGQRVVRGGSYHIPAEDVRVTRRSKFDADTAIDQIGFRVVRVR